MKKTIKGLFLAGISLLFSQACLATDGGRTELEGPGDAEVIAGTGYQHTLFDSADKKCQHCHNDLYDTWKTSMHAKSWADPLFQIKYQDFLRLQASKIGAKGPTGTYEEKTIQKSSQVCIKCHAPTAYYSGDYKVELKRVGGNHEDPGYDPVASYTEAKTMESNLSNPPSDPPKPKYNPAEPATVAALAKTGQAYTLTYHIGNSHNREGVNCSFCHSIETVRMFDKHEGSDGGKYRLSGPIKMGPIGPIVREAGDKLKYSPNADALDMNAFFALIGPEKYADVGNTPKVKRDFDDDKTADGRFTMKSIETGCEIEDENGDCVGTNGYYTGGPFYGPFGITGLSNSRDDDLTYRPAQVKPEFQMAVGEHPDKFEDKHQFAAYGKALCLSCHQRSSLMLNPESNGEPGIQPTGKDADQFLELCSTWTAMSDGVGDNFTDTRESPKCQRCHMEPLTNKQDGEQVTVLHQWDQPDVLFTKDDEEYLTAPFDPDSGYGPVAEGYMNNHAFLGHSQKDSDMQLVKVQSGFESKLTATKSKNGKKVIVKTSLQNKTAHMFPGAHPIRRVLTRVVVMDANGNMIPFESATGKTRYRSITNQLATLDGSAIKDGFDSVKVKYDDDRNIVIQGYTPDLDEDGEPVMSQKMDQTKVPWASPDGTVTGSMPVQDDTGAWSLVGETTVKKIVDDLTNNYFTRIYGRETGKRITDESSPYFGTHVIRPGFDSNIAADNRLKPNEKEKYRITYDASDVEAWPVTVKFKVYFMKKGAGGVFPTDSDTGFLDANLPDWKKKRLAITEVASEEVTLH
jgi:hypothetical protein